MSAAFSIYDLVVLGAYFGFMLLVGWVFRRAITNTSDYFRGGGSMLWWMAGSSAFMTQFSAWTFTGAAAKAYQDGGIILILYFANALGFLVSFLLTAAKFRQTRVITAVEAVRRRFGRANEQVITWLQIPMGIVYAGIWLNALGLFFAAVFGFEVNTTIIMTGVAVLFISLFGGAWAVSASDFIQVLVLMLITVVATIFTLIRLGGVGDLISGFPADSFLGNDFNYSGIIYLWMIAIIIKQVANTNNLLDSSRYLCARNTNEARKAALLATVLFFVGPVIWFIPPMAAAILIPDLAAMFPNLNKPNEVAYVAICLEVLPAGMMGMLASGMFAATMSSMDSGLNRNAGIFVRNFYFTVCRPEAKEKELMLAGKVVTIALGLMIILIAIGLNMLKGMSLFNIMLQFGTLVAMPLTIPLILAVFVRRSPDWAVWSSIIAGLLNSFLVKIFVVPENIESWFSLSESITNREGNDLVLIFGVFTNLIVCVGWFFIACRLSKHIPEKREEEIKAFFKDVDTPVGEDDSDVGKDDPKVQIRLISRVALGYGSFMLLMTLIPNPIGGRLAFAGCGIVLIIISELLKRSGKVKAEES
ncbi:sodium:solute symporter family protein [Rubellicoccus peritrichatus]|uniref:Sodium:solute symporter family protein n=1 Tax=Rubellicoccus peritrichatus TaxID=3080537 RepID=A0AAQ3QVU4_9BACT|nr:sodium:solute symporter family protein [Puniceicoccus sp. CR14]WOO41222.1 sodium:solute symporter family protein [Puniceicoccus sp. CR14]